MVDSGPHWNILTTLGFIVVKCFTDIHGAQGMNPIDFGDFSSASSWSRLSLSLWDISISTIWMGALILASGSHDITLDFLSFDHSFWFYSDHKCDYFNASEINTSYRLSCVGGCGSGEKEVIHKPEGRWFDPRSPSQHAEVSFVLDRTACWFVQSTSCHHLVLFESVCAVVILVWSHRIEVLLM